MWCREFDAKESYKFAINQPVSLLIVSMKRSIAPLTILVTVLASCGAGSEAELQEKTSVHFDTRQVDGDEIPHAEGAAGMLSYRDGCLYVSGNGVGTGLVVPSSFSFDGQVLRSEFDEVHLGAEAAFTGGVAGRTATSYECSKFFPNVLIVDNARPAITSDAD